MNKTLISTILVIFYLSTSLAEEVKSKKNSTDTYKYLETLGDAYDEIKQRYVEEPEDKKLVESAINGMLTSLDPHSTYMDAKTAEDLMADIKGEFGGLGIEVTMENNLVRVISPIDDTPASRAGIKSGDYIISIDDETVMGLTLDEAVKLMRGKPGKKIHITIIREGASEPIELDLVREVIKVKVVKSRFINGIAYLRVGKFTEQTTENLKSEVAKLISEHGLKNIQGVILDLRNNPGGLLDQAISVSDCFLDGGEVVSIRGRGKENIKRYRVDGNNLFRNIDMVVLINGGSASASEIVAGALQDYKRAVIMGTQSFGKASVQEVKEIVHDGKLMGIMKFTTSRYYTPSGKSIQAEGIIPDIIVEDAKIDLNKAKDSRLIFSESKLKGHLKKEKNTSDKPSTKEIMDNINGPNKAISENDAYQKDFQLARAVDLLRALKVVEDGK